jgi:hypothetical protein
MTRLSVNASRCEALFVSGLQRSDTPTTEAVAEAISRTVRQFGISGCTSRMAQEFGDHPEAAADRMRWVRQLVSEMSPSPATAHARQGGQPSTRPSPLLAPPAAGSVQQAA